MAGEDVALRFDYEAVYLGRPNRFTVIVARGGERLACHLHDTGRIDHLAQPGSTRVLVRGRPPSLARRTSCDVVAFIADEGPVVADSRVPNMAFSKWFRLVAPWAEGVEAERSVMGSRFDFVLLGPRGFAVVEVKGVNKAVGGYGLFPNAPSPRARRHLDTLASVARSGVRAMLVFVALRGDVRVFGPDAPVDRGFAGRLCAYRGIVEYHGLVPRVEVEWDSGLVVLRDPREAPVDACLEGFPGAGGGKG